MSRVKLIASDLDHTLLTEDGQLPPGFFDTIRAVHAAGIHFVAASGRALYTLQPMFAPVADCVSLIAENGAVVVHDGDVVATQFIPRPDYRRLLAYTAGLGGGIPVLCALDCGYIQASAASHADFLRKFFARLEVVEDLAELDVPLAKYTVFYPDKQTGRAYKADYQPQLAADGDVKLVAELRRLFLGHHAPCG